MLEQVYDTLRAILFNDLPKNVQGKPVVYNRVIKGWYFGDRSPLPDTPALIFEAADSDPKEIAQNLLEYEYSFRVMLKTGNDNVETSERVAQEMARLIREALMPHRRIWVMTACPFCLKHILSPEHFTIVHSDVLAPYVEAAQQQFAATWYETKPLSVAVPTLLASGVAVDAMALLYADVAASVTVANLSADALTAIQFQISTSAQPARLLYDGIFTKVVTTEDNKEQQLLHSGEFTIRFKEVRWQSAYGPDNVSTDAWA
jgi:hypothetical protein